jgi:hypothetical protein
MWRWWDFRVLDIVSRLKRMNERPQSDIYYNEQECVLFSTRRSTSRSENPSLKHLSFDISPRPFLDHPPSAASSISVSSPFFWSIRLFPNKASDSSYWYVSRSGCFQSLSAPQLQLMFLKSCRMGSVAIEPMQSPSFDKLQCCDEAEFSVVGAKSLDGCK